MNSIEKLRTDLKMSKTEFARIFNISPSAVAQWETGVNTPNQVNNAIMLKLREKLDKKDDVKSVITNLLLGAGFLALLTWIFSENSKK
jgi:transcriptional regulator with XRE-family HTH domain